MYLKIITSKSIVSVNLFVGDSKLKFTSVVYFTGTTLGSIQNVDWYLKILEYTYFLPIFKICICLFCTNSVKTFNRYSMPNIVFKKNVFVFKCYAPYKSVVH